MRQETTALPEFNWRRELLLIAFAAMEITWLAGWIIVLLGAGQTAGLRTVWLSSFAIYLIAMVAARVLSQRPTPRLDWIMGSLILLSTLLFLNLNLYPALSPFSPRWLSLLVGDVFSGAQTWPREITGLFVSFFLWFRGLRLPQKRRAGIRTTQGQVKLGLVMVVALAVVASEVPINAGAIVVTFFAFSLLALALTRIEEAARSEAGAASPFGRKWLVTLMGALLVVGLLTLIATNILTVEAIRTLLRPVVAALEAVLSAIAILAGLLAQYILFPIFMGVLNRIFPDGIDLSLLQNFQQQTAGQEMEMENGESVLLTPELLNALRVVGLTLLVLIVLWLVIRSFRRWRQARETSGGVRETARPSGSLAGDMLGYLQDQWQRLRQMDVRRLLRMRGTSSIRAIYANLLTLIATVDRPRQTGETPYEFEPMAERVLPAQEREISAITDAYVRARYGEQPISVEELEHLREAWQEVEGAGEELVRRESGKQKSD